jgi:hypothetical protein
LPFAYYNQLTRRQKSIYRASDQIESVRLREPDTVIQIGAHLAAALEAGDQKETTRLCNALVDAICAGRGLPAPRVRVLKNRPSTAGEELHGLYERPGENIKGESAEITVWMRTARRNQVVAFRTFMRTLLHEFCHHLDYELLGLEDSFHTQGFFKRESSLFKQIVPDRSRPV